MTLCSDESESPLGSGFSSTERKRVSYTGVLRGADFKVIPLQRGSSALIKPEPRGTDTQPHRSLTPVRDTTKTSSRAGIPALSTERVEDLALRGSRLEPGA